MISSQFLLQFLESSLTASRAEASQLVAARTAADAASAAAIGNLKASNSPGGAVLLALLHAIYLAVGVLVFVADRVEARAARLG